LRRRPKEELARGLREVDERADVADVADVAGIAGVAGVAGVTGVADVADVADCPGTLAASARVLRSSILFPSGCGPASFTSSTYLLLKSSVPRIC
jgi:hypothetical protein